MDKELYDKICNSAIKARNKIQELVSISEAFPEYRFILYFLRRFYNTFDKEYKNLSWTNVAISEKEIYNSIDRFGNYASVVYQDLGMLSSSVKSESYHVMALEIDKIGEDISSIIFLCDDYVEKENKRTNNSNYGDISNSEIEAFKKHIERKYFEEYPEELHDEIRKNRHPLRESSSSEGVPQYDDPPCITAHFPPFDTLKK